MEPHPLVEVAFAVVLGIGVAAAVLWFYAGYGAWMDDAYENGRWVWFCLLLAFTFPASLISWVVVRAFAPRLAGTRVDAAALDRD
jgi:hypothetical protein